MTSIGPPLYMAPEILSNQPSGISCDIWSLGCILYEIMKGNLPFLANSISELFLKLQTQEPSPILGDYSQDLKNLLGQMLQKNALYRISAKDILNSRLIINFKNTRMGKNK
jgi:serine/threonine protein kinase